MPSATFLLALAILAPAPPQAPKPVSPGYVVPPTVIPRTLDGILEMLRKDERETRAMIDGASRSNVYGPFTRVRDLSLALEPRIAQLPQARRAGAGIAVRAAMRTAWLLHESADAGTPGQTAAALRLFHDAIAALVAAFEDRR
jgi:hypothetical protein